MEGLLEDLAAKETNKDHRVGKENHEAQEEKVKDLREFRRRMGCVGAHRPRHEDGAQQHKRQRHSDEQVDRE